MGTGYKGNTKFYRSTGQNLLIVSKSFDYNEGYFGVPSTNGNSRVRTISSGNSLNSAYNFYDKLANGGIESVINSNCRVTRMADGTVITMRVKSSSDGTPAVDINVKESTHTGGIKHQKIHFVQEETSK